MNVANEAEMNKTIRYQEDEHKSQQIRHWKPAQDFPRLKTNNSTSKGLDKHSRQRQNDGEQLLESL